MIPILHFFLSSKNTPLYGYTTFYLSVHQLTDIWVVTTFQLLLVMLLEAVTYKFSHGHMFTFPLDIYLGMELLGHMETLFKLLKNCQTVQNILYFYMICRWKYPCFKLFEPIMQSWFTYKHKTLFCRVLVYTEFLQCSHLVNQGKTSPCLLGALPGVGHCFRKTVTSLTTILFVIFELSTKHTFYQSTPVVLNHRWVCLLPQGSMAMTGDVSLGLRGGWEGLLASGGRAQGCW